MKYKTVRESGRPLSVGGLLIGVIGIFCTIFILMMKGDALNDPASFVGLYIGLLSILGFVYCWTSDVKRKVFRKYGKKFNGYIIGAEWRLNGRGEDTYYLLISFHEDGTRRIRYTEGYVGNPNCKLRNMECEIYKWHNKYIEMGFNLLNKNEKPVPLHIPITTYHFLKKKKEYV